MLLSLLDLPKRHPRLVAVLASVFANKGALQKTLEAEKEIGLIFDRRHDDGAQPNVFACKAIGQYLVAKHGGFCVGGTQLLSG